MRCPNCSFNNPDDADECRICGFELTPVTLDSEKKSKRYLDDNDDQLDETVNALFGDSASPKAPNKKIDKRFEAYADMPEEVEATPEQISDDELKWLETLQSDLQKVDDEFRHLRTGKGTVKDEIPVKSTDDDEVMPEPDPIFQSKVVEIHKVADRKPIATISEAQNEAVSSPSQTISTFEPQATVPNLEKDVPLNTEPEFEIDDDTEVINLNFTVTEMPSPPVVEPAKAPSQQTHQQTAKPAHQTEPQRTPRADHGHGHREHTDTTGEAVQHPKHLKSKKNAKQAFIEQDEDTHDLYDDTFDEDEPVNPNAQRNKLVVLAFLLVLLLVIFFKMFLPSGNQDDTQNPEDSTPAQEEPQTTGDPSDSEAIAEQTGIFFGQLQSYVNNGNIAVLSMFVDSQNALEQLSTFKNLGTLDDFTLSLPDDITVVDNTSEIDVAVGMTRTVDGASAESTSDWKFKWTYTNEHWLIENLSIDGATTVDSSVTAGNNTSTPDTNSNAGGNTTTTTTTAPADTVAKPEGFLTTGSFTGGIITDGQDVSGIRFGRHEAFERLVFDLSAWTGGTPTTLVNEACHYEAKLSSDGKTITLVMSGVRGISAGSADLSLSTYFASVKSFVPEDDSAVGFTITLNQASAFKVFSLQNPGKIVVDVMPK